jgi:lysophospholipase L1-like esterase
MRVLVFGDSITQGFFAETAGWVQRLFNYYSAKILEDVSRGWIEIFNLGISGDRTNWLLERLEPEIYARISHWPNEEVILVFAIGINDTAFDGNRERSNVAKYQNSVNELITMSKNFTSKVLLVGLTACEEEVVNNRTYKSKHLSNERIEAFEKVLGAIADDNQVSHVPIFNTFKTNLDAREKLLADGIHPNDAGHQLIFELVLPELDKLINT